MARSALEGGEDEVVSLAFDDFSFLKCASQIRLLRNPIASLRSLHRKNNFSYSRTVNRVSNARRDSNSEAVNKESPRFAYNPIASALEVSLLACHEVD